MLPLLGVLRSKTKREFPCHCSTNPESPCKSSVTLPLVHVFNILESFKHVAQACPRN